MLDRASIRYDTIRSQIMITALMERRTSPWVRAAMQAGRESEFRRSVLVCRRNVASRRRKVQGSCVWHDGDGQRMKTEGATFADPWRQRTSCCKKTGEREGVAATEAAERR